MAVVLDPHGRQWTVRRKWWSFPAEAVNDIIDIAIYTWIVLLLLLVPFVLAWPVWLMTKFARWVIVIERNGAEVGREMVRGWSKSTRRIDEIVDALASGEMSGNDTI